MTLHINILYKNIYTLRLFCIIGTNEILTIKVIICKLYLLKKKVTKTNIIEHNIKPYNIICTDRRERSSFTVGQGLEPLKVLSIRNRNETFVFL